MKTPEVTEFEFVPSKRTRELLLIASGVAMGFGVAMLLASLAKERSSEAPRVPTRWRADNVTGLKVEFPRVDRAEREEGPLRRLIEEDRSFYEEHAEETEAPSDDAGAAGE